MTKEDILLACNKKSEGTLMESLEIEFTDVSENILVAKMPVTPKVHQPDGLLHGGASVALAETVGSAAAFVFIGKKNIKIRAIEISANHLKSIREGFVYAKAEAIHIGRTTQLWQIRITDKNNELISLVKLTTIAIYQ